MINTMFSQIKEAVSLLSRPGKISVALRWRLQLYLFSFLAVIFIALATFIIVFDVFSPHKEAKASLDLQLDRFEHRLDNYFRTTAAQGIHFAQQVSRVIETTLEEKNVGFDEVPDNQELIALLEKNTYSLLYDSLRIADCSGAFIIFDVTVNTKLPNADQSRSGSYLKLANANASKSASPAVAWARGIHEIGHDNNHIFHNRWQLEFDISRLPFYETLIQSATRNPADGYYYSSAFKFHGIWEKIMILGVPIVGKNGQVYGICGFEINSLLFKLIHAEAGSPYKRTIGLVAQKEGGRISLETGLEFGTRGGYYAGLGDGVLEVKPAGGLRHYYLSGGSGETRDFIGLDTEITLSPLSDKPAAATWVAACLIPKEDYDRLVYFSYLKLALFCLVFLSIAVIAVYLISKRYNLPILRGIESIKEGSLEKTYINEIDDLLEFLARGDAAAPNGAAPGEAAHEASATDVDMSAFYEFQANVKKLSRAETAIFDLYMKGLSAPEIAEKLFVSINTIKSHNKNIYRKLNVSSRKELLVYAQMMKNSD